MTTGMDRDYFIQSSDDSEAEADGRHTRSIVVEDSQDNGATSQPDLGNNDHQSWCTSGLCIFCGCKRRSVRVRSGEGENHELVLAIMAKHADYISNEVAFDVVRQHLVPIFGRAYLQKAEGENKSNVEIMAKICKKARKLSLEDFVRFSAALKKANQQVFDNISREYIARTGSNLPAVQSQELDNDTIPSPAQSQNQLHYIASTPSVHVSQSDGLPAPQTDRKSSCIDSSEFKEKDCSSLPISYVTPVECSSGQISPKPGHPNLTTYYKKFAQNPDDVYRMDSQPRGLCLIINNEEFHHLRLRDGSRADFDNLKRMFTFLGFDLLTHKNKTAAEILDILKIFAKFPGLGDVSALAVVVLSHGGINDCIYGSDGAADHNVPVRGTFIMKFDLQQMFISRNCPLMEGKPKLFIIQACRGDEEDQCCLDQNCNALADGCPNPNNIFPDTRDASVTKPKHPVQDTVPTAETANMCFLHPVSLGYKAYRDREHGSPFVKHLTEALVRSAHEKSLQDIIRELQREFSTKRIGSTKMTMPEVTYCLTKMWYLNPPPAELSG